MRTTSFRAVISLDRSRTLFDSHALDGSMPTVWRTDSGLKHIVHKSEGRGGSLLWQVSS